MAVLMLRGISRVLPAAEMADQVENLPLPFAVELWTMNHYGSVYVTDGKQAAAVLRMAALIEAHAICKDAESIRRMRSHGGH